MDRFAEVLAAGHHSATLCEDAQGRVLMSNARWLDMVGDRTDGNGDAGVARLLERVHPEDRARLRTEFDIAQTRHACVQFQVRIGSDEPGVRWASVYRDPVLDDDRTLLGWVTTITPGIVGTGADAWTAAAVLSDAERLTHIGAWSWQIETGALWWSDEVYRIFGLSPQEFSVTYESFLERIHPNDRAEVERRVGLAVNENEPYDIRHRIIRIDGSRCFVRERGEVTRGASGKAVRMLGTIQDVTEETEEQLSREGARRALATLSKGNALLLHATDEENLLQQMCVAAVDAGGYRLAWYARVLYDGSYGFDPLGAAGPSQGYLDGIVLTWDEQPTANGPSGRAVKSGKPVVIEDSQTDPGFVTWKDKAARHGIYSSVSIPVRMGSKIDGVLSVYSGEAHFFDSTAVGVLEELCLELGFGLERLQSTRRINETLEGTIRVLAATVEVRDPYTAGHQSRVAALSEMIARKLGIPEFDIRGVHLAALIHDVGKIAIPVELLTRPGVLRETYGTHPRAREGR